MNADYSPGPSQRGAALQVVLAIAECLRDLGEVPSGEFYARLCGMPLLGQMTAPQYQRLIEVLKAAGLVQERSHLLTWIGPKLEGGVR